ncbi:Ubiquinone/menaquinone biosynthesis methyltransferase ubie, partial [Globisporangium splendens]
MISRQSLVRRALLRSASCAETAAAANAGAPRSFSSSRTLPSAESGGSTTHFGFQQVREEEKKPMVASVFHKVAERYDIMNDFMSGGLHRVWKDSFIDLMHPVGPLRVLDVAGGTGDIAFRIAQRLSTPKNAYGEGSSITICDINSSMLEVGRERAAKLLPEQNHMFQWVQGDAEQLQFESNSFDVYTIAFGIRNVTHVDKALAEAYRVLKPGGRFMCLEFSQVPNPLIRTVYDAYLVESIRQFPPQEKFKSMMEDVGFKRTSYTNYTHGVVAVHSGFKF